MKASCKYLLLNPHTMCAHSLPLSPHQLSSLKLRLYFHRTYGSHVAASPFSLIGLKTSFSSPARPLLKGKHETREMVQWVGESAYGSPAPTKRAASPAPVQWETLSQENKAEGGVCVRSVLCAWDGVKQRAPKESNKESWPCALLFSHGLCQGGRMGV